MLGLFQAILDKLTNFEGFLVLMTWASAFVGAYITFLVRRDHGQPRTVRGFARFCFPREILRSRSLYLDIGYAISFRFLYPIAVAPFLIAAIVAAKFSRDLVEHFLGTREAVGQPGLAIWLVYVAGMVLFRDFVVFYVHYLQHRIPLLWEFHKVHHSAEHLVPLTNRRFHPFQILLDEGSETLCVGIWLGLTSYALGIELADATILGIDGYFLTQILCFYHLRHSHVYMTFGALEPVLMSPAQHQMHHSIDPKHWDKNFGLTFPYWDQLWGTHLVAEPSRWFKLGLSGNEHLEYNTILQLYIRPFRKAFRLLFPRRPVVSTIVAPEANRTAKPA
jgi:sterol desaturase/sphingolipid hydroxylase (fatty acid hydroxylase superfamily)